MIIDEEFGITGNFVIVKTGYGPVLIIIKGRSFFLRLIARQRSNCGKSNVGLDLCIISIEGCEEQKRFLEK
ncbi:hypothetical protein P9C02_18475 [Bacillus paralicheniformis]|uniref:hypothetical protein n=1 Tax=Bacillus paralicheniformis TaxID=1648923 RepID=UPI002DBEE211|nr:hypothetical protein [Bacillus paralicheniformis]MEC1192444.1 hypothetical protein [Bacillus paralicheniformis]MEC1280581.1 hypothetical protein [Bacillus paralicheniformis]MEC1298609.1 hypothetical protein [Bacillus paralicheniformis]